MTIPRTFKEYTHKPAARGGFSGDLPVDWKSTASRGDVMGFQSTHPEYNVRVDGLRVGRTRFLIQAAITYGSQLTAAARERARRKAQIEVVLAVLGEWDRGIRLGAKEVRIAVVGDRHLDRLFRAWPHDVSTSAEAFGRDTSRPRRRRSARGPVPSSRPKSPTRDTDP
jgi:hypothetical protein